MPEDMPSSARPGAKTGGAKVFLLFTAAAICFWGLMYAGTSWPIRLQIALSTAACGAVGYLLQALLSRLFRRSPGAAPRASYLALGILFAAPVLLFMLEAIVNREGVDLITTRSTLGIVATLLISLFILVAYQLIGRLTRPPFEKFDRPLFVLTVLVTLFVPGFIMAPAEKERRADRVESYEIVNRVTVDRPGGPARRIVVLGIDGATWNVITPLVERGLMPNLHRLMTEGSYGELMSDEAARSPVVWTTIFSGFPPEIHGVNRWETSLSTNRRVKALWNIVNEYGKAAVVVNVPGSFPAEQVQGSMISGFPVPMATLNNLGWLFSTSDPGGVDIPSGKLSFERSATGARALRAEAGIPISTPADVRSVIPAPGMMLGDRVSVHHFLAEFLINRQLRKSSGAHEVKLYVFKGVDGDAVEVSLSPEGEPALATLKPGRWSAPIDFAIGERRFFFKVKQLAAPLPDVAIYVSPIYPAPFGAGLPLAFPTTPEEFPAPFPDHYVVEGPGWGTLQNAELTEAFWELQRDIASQQADYADALFRSGSWGLFATVYTLTDRIQHSLWKFREPQYFEPVPSSFVERFGSLIDETYLEVDRRIGALLGGLGDEDLVVVLSDHGFQARQSSLFQKDHQSGTHKREGIFIFHGRGVKSAGPAARPFLRAELLQVVPTILYLAGMPIGEDMSGGVLTGIVDDGFLADHPIERIPTYNTGVDGIKAPNEIEESTKEQLKSLGYVQ